MASASGIVLIATLVGISVVRNAGAFATISASMYIAALALGALGMLLGGLVARAAGLGQAQRRTVVFETGVQNSPLCFAILVTAFPGEAQLEMLKLPLLYALFILVQGTLATLLYRALDARRPPSPSPLGEGWGEGRSS